MGYEKAVSTLSWTPGDGPGQRVTKPNVTDAGRRGQPTAIYGNYDPRTAESAQVEARIVKFDVYLPLDNPPLGGVPANLEI